MRRFDAAPFRRKLTFPMAMTSAANYATPQACLPSRTCQVWRESSGFWRKNAAREPYDLSMKSPFT
jgi:hypothetical protein